jgi:hypothetical protein
MHPSGCPKFYERDKAELEEQYRKDAAMWNPPQQPSGTTENGDG